LGGSWVRGREESAGTEMVYCIALQKQPPWRTKGVVGSEAIGGRGDVVVLVISEMELVALRRHCGVDDGGRRDPCHSIFLRADRCS